MESATSSPIAVKPPPYPYSLSTVQVTSSNSKRNFNNNFIGSHVRTFFNSAHTPITQQHTNLLMVPAQPQINRNFLPAAAAAANFPVEFQLPQNQFFCKGNSGDPCDQSFCNKNLDYSYSGTNCNNTTNHPNKCSSQHDLKDNPLPIPSTEEILVAMSLASTMGDNQDFQYQSQTNNNNYDALCDISKAVHHQGMNVKLNYSDSSDFLVSNTLSDNFPSSQSFSSHTPFTPTISSINRSPSSGNEVEPQTILSLDNNAILVDVHHSNKQLLEEVTGSQRQSRGNRITLIDKLGDASTTGPVNKVENDWTYTVGEDVTGTRRRIFPSLQPELSVVYNAPPPQCSTPAVSVVPVGPSSSERPPYAGPGSDYYVEPLISGNTTWSPVVSTCESEIESEKDLRDEISSLEFQNSQDSWNVNIQEVEKLMSLEDLFRSWSESLPDDFLQVPVHDATTATQNFGSKSMGNIAVTDERIESRSSNVVTPDLKPLTTILSPQLQDDSITESPVETFTAIFDKNQTAVPENSVPLPTLPTKKRKRREPKRKTTLSKVASVVGKPTLPMLAAIVTEDTLPKVALTIANNVQFPSIETGEKKMWILPCKICGSKLQGGKQRYEAHMKNCHEWTCSCGEVYKSKASLMKHIEENEFITPGSSPKTSVHSITLVSMVKPTFECDLCNEVFKTICAAKKHRKIVHSIEDIPEPKVALPKDCCHCKEKFNLRKDLKAHLKVCPVRNSDSKPKAKKLPRLNSSNSIGCS